MVSLSLNFIFSIFPISGALGGVVLYGHSSHNPMINHHPYMDIPYYHGKIFALSSWEELF
jgi:hypothetical protein